MKQAKNNSFEKDVLKLVEINEKLQEENNSLKKASESFAKESSSLKKERDSLKKENNSLKKENDLLKRENNVFKKEAAELKKENEELKENLSSLDSVRERVLSALANTSFVDELDISDNEPKEYTEYDEPESDEEIVKDEYVPVENTEDGIYEEEYDEDEYDYDEEEEEILPPEPEPMPVPVQETEPEIVEESIPMTPDVEDDDGVVEDVNLAFPYADDIYSMQKNEFTFTYTTIMTFDDDHSPITRVDIMAIPLHMKTKKPPILLWVVTAEGVNSFIYDGGLSNKKLTISGIEFAITCKITGGIFKTFISIDGYDSEHLDISTKNYGNKGHLYLSFEGAHIHICPLSFKNGEDGLAEFVYCFERDGVYSDCGDNTSEHLYVTDSMGYTKDVMALWKDTSLYGGIISSEADEEQ